MAQVDSGHSSAEAQTTHPGISAAEYSRARAMVEQLQGRVTELEEELATAHEELERLRAAAAQEKDIAGQMDVMDQVHRRSGGSKREPDSRMRPTTLPSASTS
jgi:septation ring formation regulator EzrA